MKTTTGLGLDDLYRTYQERSINGEDYNRTVSAVAKAQQAFRSGHRLDQKDIGQQGFGTFGASADKFASAVDKLLSDQNELYVLKNH